MCRHATTSCVLRPLYNIYTMAMSSGRYDSEQLQKLRVFVRRMLDVIRIVWKILVRGL